MEPIFINRGGQLLRCGYTTGSCAAAASKAAVRALLSGVPVAKERLLTPKGIELELDICDMKMLSDSVSCAVIKDGGDDPDITHGIYIYSKAEMTEKGITIEGGEGVGIVTKAGLDQPVGSAAINSMPRKCITEAVNEVCEEFEYYGGIRITIYVPDGRELAKKTYNPRMGVEGGISIIGTSGIVEPMSSKALIDTIRLEANMRKAEGCKNILLTLGNYGDSFLAQNFPFAVNKNVKCANFIGEAIDIAVELGFEGVLIAGHIGKLSKLAAGIMNTHSAQADGRIEVMIYCGLLAGCDNETLLRVSKCATADAALEIFEELNMTERVMEIMLSRIQYYLDARVKGRLKIGVVLFSNAYGMLGKTAGADELTDMLRKETENYND